MRVPFTGMGTALVTPFTSDGAIDEKRVRELVRRQVDAGIHFVSPCGTTGEAPTLSHDEKVRIVEIVVDAPRNGRLVGKAESPDMYAAIDKASDVLAALLRRLERSGALGTSRWSR